MRLVYGSQAEEHRPGRRPRVFAIGSLLLLPVMFPALGGGKQNKMGPSPHSDGKCITFDGGIYIAVLPGRPGDDFRVIVSLHGIVNLNSLHIPRPKMLDLFSFLYSISTKVISSINLLLYNL